VSPTPAQVHRLSWCSASARLDCNYWKQGHPERACYVERMTLVGLSRQRERARFSVAALGLLILCAVSSSSAFAQEGAATNTTPIADSTEEAKRESPRAAVQTFLELARAQRFAEAGRLLDLAKLEQSRRAELARRLKAVLDRRLWLDLEKVSAAEAGDVNDGLAPDLEQLGSVSSKQGRTEPVRLRRLGDRSGWLFSSATVGRVDDWYDGLEDRWLLEHLPPWLLRSGPAGLLWWQWLGLLALIAGAAVGGTALSALLRWVLGKVASRTPSRWDERLLARTVGPVRLAFSLALLRVSSPFLLLYPPAEERAHDILRGMFLANILWFCWRIVDVLAELSWDSPWSHQHPGSRALIPLARRAGKAVVSVAAVILFLSALGYPVTSLIAGLGLGGLAFALASQKTVENLFGAFSLGIDQPFREGDFVRIEELVGTVESLGLRSTKIRTLDRTLVSFPNGKLAEMRLESFSARDRLRLACTVRLVYETTEAQMRAVLAGLERVLREHPNIWPDSVTVRFKELAASSLDIEIMAWFTTSDWAEFQAIREDVLLSFMGVVESVGTSFAFPTRTVHVAGARASLDRQGAA
jgi:MscS family membrane protein